MVKGKMLGNKKVFGRCRVSGHGCGCNVSRDIQGKPVSRAEEKRGWSKEVLQEVDDMSLRDGSRV